MQKLPISKANNAKVRYYSEDARPKRYSLKRLPKLGQKSLDISDLPKDRAKYLNLFEDIEKLCDSYDQLPVIEFQDDEDPKDEVLVRDTESRIPTSDSKMNFIISQLKLRIKNYPKAQAAYPSSNRFKVFSGTEEKVGPGTYKANPASQLETYEFSNIPRLFTPIAHTLHTIESLYKKRGEVNEDAIIRKNKLLAINPQQLKDEFSIKIYQLKVKEKYARVKKEMIEKQKFAEKSLKLSEKIRKFEWRMTKEEVFKVQTSWAFFIVCIGMQCVLNCKGKYKRVMRIRWGKILKKFTLMSRIIGKVLVRLKSIRKRIIKKRLTHLYTPFRELLKTEISYKKKIVQWIFEKTRDMPVIIHLMSKWKKSIDIIQRNMKSIKKISKARKSSLGILWDKIMENLHKTKMQEKIHRSLTLDRFYTMPELIKEKFIKKYITEVITEYAKERRFYSQTIKSLKAQSTNEKANFSKIIAKPILTLFSKRAKLGIYIEMANSYKAKLEKKQREMRYNLTQFGNYSKSLTKKV